MFLILESSSSRPSCPVMQTASFVGRVAAPAAASGPSAFELSGVRLSMSKAKLRSRTLKDFRNNILLDQQPHHHHHQIIIKTIINNKNRHHHHRQHRPTRALGIARHAQELASLSKLVNLRISMNRGKLRCAKTRDTKPPQNRSQTDFQSLPRCWKSPVLLDEGNRSCTNGCSVERESPSKTGAQRSCPTSAMQTEPMNYSK